MEVELLAAIVDRHLPPFAMPKPVPITLHQTKQLHTLLCRYAKMILSVQRGSPDTGNGGTLPCVINLYVAQSRETICVQLPFVHGAHAPHKSASPLSMVWHLGMMGTYCKEEWA